MTSPTSRRGSRDLDGPRARLPVTDGYVGCPRRGLVDILECFVCPFSQGLSGEHSERVLCVWTRSLPTVGGWEA